MAEIWRDIPDYVGLYQASNLGRIRSLPRVVVGGKGKAQDVPGGILKHSKDSYGYHVVSLCNSTGKAKTKVCKVHRLILAAFRGKSTLMGRHLDDNKDNNALVNLEYGTGKDNAADRTRNGTKVGATGADNGAAKLDEPKVKVIKERLAKGDSARSIAKTYSVSPSAILKIKNGETWSAV